MSEMVLTSYFSCVPQKSLHSLFVVFVLFGRWSLEWSLCCLEQGFSSKFPPTPGANKMHLTILVWLDMSIDILKSDHLDQL